MNTCPLCDSKNIQDIDTLPLETVRKVYREEYDFDVSDLVSTDLNHMQCRDCELKFFDPCTPADGSFYSQLQTFPWYYPGDKFEYRLVKDWIPETAWVLEVGCGTGEFACQLTTKNYTGLEFNPTATDGVRILDETVEQHSQTHKQHYDFVLAFQVLEHVPNPKSFIQACCDCLTQCGTLVLGLPSDSSWLGQARLFGLNMPPHHVTRWPDATVKKLAELFDLRLDALVMSPFEHSYALKFVENKQYHRGDVVVAKYTKI
jgi:2-polyprenyl-3-methyl-5-hydroxy-6-metoxy-1,4-benzoquinol methylase